jgi:hypothetical protein
MRYTVRDWVKGEGRSDWAPLRLIGGIILLEHVQRLVQHIHSRWTLRWIFQFLSSLACVMPIGTQRQQKVNYKVYIKYN